MLTRKTAQTAENPAHQQPTGTLCDIQINTMYYRQIYIIYSCPTT